MSRIDPDAVLREVPEGYTPGPLHVAHHGTWEVESATGAQLADCGTIGTAKADATLYAQAPALVAALRVAVEQRDEARRMLGEAEERGRLAGVEEGRERVVARSGVYVVSRASIPERPAMWRALREDGWPIVATWIDEDAPGATVDRGELLSRCIREASSAERVVVYVEPGDLPLKIGWVEIGAALSVGVHVFVVASDVPDAALGHLTAHPLVYRCGTVELAMTINGGAHAAKEKEG